MKIIIEFKEALPGIMALEVRAEDAASVTPAEEHIAKALKTGITLTLETLTKQGGGRQVPGCANPELS